MIDAPHTSMPPALRDVLAQARDEKRQAAAAGGRLTVVNVRESFERLTRTYNTDIPDIGLVRDELIPAPNYPVPVRIYHPKPSVALPVALFLHGGGHVAGNVAIYDAIERKLALKARCIVVGVEYRLAPECPYPAALKDTIACAKRLFQALADAGLAHERRLMLIGDSGGGALSATISHLAQFDPGLSIERQVLLYPSLDYTLSQPSTRELAEGCLLERDRMLWLFDAYLQGHEDRRAVSPLFMELTEAYPPTLIVTAGCDPLRDEGMAYAKRLTEQGIGVERLAMPNMVHAYLNLEDLVPDACGRTYDAIAAFLALGGCGNTM